MILKHYGRTLINIPKIDNIDFYIPTSVLFKDVKASYGLVTINLYEYIRNALLKRIERFGIYLTFKKAIDCIIDGDVIDYYIDDFENHIKNKVIKDISNGKILIVNWYVNDNDYFNVTFEYDFESLWEDYKKNKIE